MDTVGKGSILGKNRRKRGDGSSGTDLQMGMYICGLEKGREGNVEYGEVEIEVGLPSSRAS